MNNIQCIMYSVQYTMYNIQFKVYSVHVQYTVFSVYVHVQYTRYMYVNINVMHISCITRWWMLIRIKVIGLCKIIRIHKCVYVPLQSKSGEIMSRPRYNYIITSHTIVCSLRTNNFNVERGGETRRFSLAGEKMPRYLKRSSSPRSSRWPGERDTREDIDISIDRELYLHGQLK